MLTAKSLMEVTAMRRLIIAFVAAVALAGCGSNGSTSAPTMATEPISTSSATAKPLPPDWTVPLTQNRYAPRVDPAQFTDKITNNYFPLVPGTVMVYEGKRDGVPLRIELTVTNETKDIFGVKTIVVRDVVTGALEERTSDWYAQDAAGNVWYFGEDTKEYTNGVVSSTAGSCVNLSGASPHADQEGGRYSILRDHTERPVFEPARVSGGCGAGRRGRGSRGGHARNSFALVGGASQYQN